MLSHKINAHFKERKLFLIRQGQRTSDELLPVVSKIQIYVVGYCTVFDT